MRERARGGKLGTGERARVVSVIAIFQQLAAPPWLGSVKWANVRYAATWRMGHHHRCHSLLAIAARRLVLNCELGNAVETQKKASRLVAVACR